jgi:magnesium transporter
MRTALKEAASMLALFHKRHPPVGARPGTLVVTETDVPPRIHVMRYDRSGLEESDVEDVEVLPSLIGGPRLTWIDIQGLGDEHLLRRVGEIFALHPLALEDLVNVPQRPKIEHYEEHLLLITRMVRLHGPFELIAEQVSLVLGPSWVLSIQEHYGDVLDPVRVRLREGKGPIRESGTDYLAYALLDTIADGYYPIMEELGDAAARLESRIMGRPVARHVDRINALSTMLDSLRRGLGPQREALGRLLRERSPFVSEPVQVYLRDTADHCAQLLDGLESHRELVRGLMNTYLSVMSNRTNEVMKMLTITASVFIPLTFLAGIYGMNFEAMPEIHSSWGYPAVLVLMGLSAAGMLLYFRRRGWLGGDQTDVDDED